MRLVLKLESREATKPYQFMLAAEAHFPSCEEDIFLVNHQYHLLKRVKDGMQGSIEYI